MTDGEQRNWDGNQNDRMVEDGVREMTVRAKWMLVMRTFGKRTTDRETVMTMGV